MATRMSVLALAVAMASGTAFAASEGEVSGGKATSATTDAGASGPTAGGDIQGEQPAPGAVTDFDRVDVDRDQQISREEAAEHDRLAERFDELDRNRDENLDEAEFAPFEEEQASAAPEAGGAAELSGGKATSATTDPGASGPTAGGALGGGEVPSAQVTTDFDRMEVERLDADQDRQLSREEVSEHPQISERFDALDTNGDGVLEESEFAVLYEEPYADTPDVETGVGAPEPMEGEQR